MPLNIMRGPFMIFFKSTLDLVIFFVYLIMIVTSKFYN